MSDDFETTWGPRIARANAVMEKHSHLDHKRIFDRIEHRYASDIYRITDRAAVAGLSDYELAVVASQWYVPFGYEVSWDRITVWTD